MSLGLKSQYRLKCLFPSVTMHNHNIKQVRGGYPTLVTMGRQGELR